MEVISAASAAALPGLAELVIPGSGIPVAASVATISSLFGRHGSKQTENLIEELRERVARLEDEGKLDRERLERLDENGGLQALYANAFSVPEKTPLYADLLAGTVSTDAPDPLDLESFLATLQSLSVEEIALAARVYDSWTNDESMARSEGVTLYSGEDTEYRQKRLEGAGLVTPRLKTGPPGSGVPRATHFDPTPTLLRLVELLRAGGRVASAEDGPGGEPNA